MKAIEMNAMRWSFERRRSCSTAGSAQPSEGALNHPADPGCRNLHRTPGTLNPAAYAGRHCLDRLCHVWTAPRMQEGK